VVPGCAVGGLTVAVRRSGGHGTVGAAENSVVVDRRIDSDLAVRLGDLGETGDRGTGWNGLRGVGDSTGRHWGWWGL
jgi:hypothetical protein